MVIKELSYKLEEYAELIQLPIQNQSGTFKESSKPVRQGSVSLTEVTAYIPNITPELNNELAMIVALGAIFECKDFDGNSYTIGQKDLKASLEFEKKNDGKAGSKYGYEIKIQLNSPNGAEFKSFQPE
jgi:hypothetical protein